MGTSADRVAWAGATTTASSSRSASKRGTEMPLQFQILGPDRIRQTDLEGKPIVSDLPYELHSDGALDPIDVSLFLGGQMTYQADGARFTECLTGRSYAIAAGGEAERLQQAYLADVAQPGTALFVSFEGTITRRPGLESGQIEPVVTVQRFISTSPGRSCPSPAVHGTGAPASDSTS